MNKIKQQAKQLSKLLPKITRNLRVAPLIEEVKPGLTTSQLMILIILKDMKGVALPVGKLAQELSVSFPAVSGIVDRLHKDQLIEKIRSKHDRRVILVKLSDTGEKIIIKLLNTIEGILFNVLKKISEKERKTFIIAIERVFEFSVTLSKNDNNKNIFLSKNITV